MDAQAARIWPRSHYHLQFHRVTSSREALSWAGRPRPSIPKLNVLQGVYVTQAYGLISVLQQGWAIGKRNVSAHGGRMSRFATGL